jgi:YD repeat-containing protein
MTGDCHVRFCESPRVKPPRATHPYSYDELGERTKTTPEKGPATADGYDQAGNLISVPRLFKQKPRWV